MSTALRATESVRHGARRIGLEQIDALLDDLQYPTDSGRIHDTRRGCKSLRALLRLFRGGLDRAVRHAENSRWRDLARMLGHARDAEVRLATFRGLITRPNSCRSLAQHLVRDAEAAKQAVPKPSVHRRLLRQARAGRAVWENVLLHHHGWKLLKPGLCTAYRAARKASRAASKEPSDEHFHEWRKHVKTLWNQLRLLSKVQPKKTRPICLRLEKLGILLGEDHDLAMLKAYAQARDGSSLDVLVPLIADRRAALQRKALKQGKRIFADGPAEFDRMARKWWQHFSK